MDKTLNRAMLVVLTTQYKKDALEAHKAVEEAGYVISKWNGCWHIKNLSTKKVIWADSGKYNCTIYSNRTTYRFRWDNSAEYSGCKADLKGMLDKPENTAYIEYLRARQWTRGGVLGGTDISDKISALKGAKNAIKTYEDLLKKTRKEIEVLTKQLEDEVVGRENAKNYANTVRARYGLKAR